MVNKAVSTASNVYNPLSIEHASVATSSTAAESEDNGTAAKDSPTSSTSSGEYNILENVLMLLAISVGAYAGCLIRIGFSMYRIWNVESNYVKYLKYCFKQ